MTTPKKIPNSNTHPAAMTSPGRNAPLLTSYPVEGRCTTCTLFVIILVAVCGAGLVLAQDQAAQPPARQQQYQVSNLPSVGGTSSGGNSINAQSWVAGYSRYPDRNRHAALWRSSLLTDLGTLGGPNSSVAWNVKNTAGILVGISQTLTPEPVENWSSRNFYSTPNNVGYINHGFD